MTRKLARVLAAAVLLASTITLQAQDGNVIEYDGASCFPAGEMPVLQVRTAEKGELRAYFRHVNTTDWCSVVGVNLGSLSSVTMPKFESGADIEYYFLLIDGKRVVAKSPRIYRVHVNDKCTETPVARHTIIVMMDCATNGANSIPASMGAGYSVKNTPVRPATPSSPSQSQ